MYLILSIVGQIFWNFSRAYFSRIFPQDAKPLVFFAPDSCTERYFYSFVSNAAEINSGYMGQ